MVHKQANDKYDSNKQLHNSIVISVTVTFNISSRLKIVHDGQMLGQFKKFKVKSLVISRSNLLGVTILFYFCESVILMDSIAL